jgi:hypothetical protein
VSQLTLYLDEESLRAVKAAARRERLSVSKAGLPRVRRYSLAAR